MDLHLVKKMFLSIFCLAIAAQLIQGATQCVRTNKDPLRHCTDECMPVTGCRNPRKKCLCDRDCGYSCIYPKIPQTNCKDPGTQGLLLRTTEARKSFKPGTILSYYCPHKFTLNGSRSLACRIDGMWSASLPRCLVTKCDQPVLPPHTQVIQPKKWKNRRDYGIRFTLSCDYGYTFTTQGGTLVCDAPYWKLEPSTFKCFPKNCPDPGTPRNGNIKGLFRVGEKVSYTCDKCYQLKGPAYRHCQADQTWTDSQPTCEPATCRFLRNPTNGYLTSNSQQCDTTVQYHCNHGYQLNGSPRRRCQSDGTWSGNEPLCVDRNLNIALGHPAFMSSHWPVYGGTAELAVDGNRRGKFFQTKNEHGPWWKVDLLKVETVSTVIVVNRRMCCTQRLNGFKVSVGNNFKEAEKNTECGGRSKAVGGENIIHCSKPLRGRFVAVYLPKTTYNSMALLEVEVYKKKLEE